MVRIWDHLEPWDTLQFLIVRLFFEKSPDDFVGAFFMYSEITTFGNYEIEKL